jgi:ectoine hydroxylase-related dioxygenase (phytanoyl-CoA dioxygenase family)
MLTDSPNTTSPGAQNTALSESQKEQFRSDGYTVVPGVLSPAEVARTRAFLAAQFDSGEHELIDEEGALVDVLTRFEELRFLLANDRLVGSLRSLLGEEFVLFPISAAHDSVFGIWHKDTTAPERAGLDFHHQPDFLMAQVALYLQDNGEHGGGLRIVPGSHRESDRAAKRNQSRSLRNRVAHRLEQARCDRRAIDIPSKAGDLLMFDFRLNHKGTPPSGPVQDIPPDHRKFAIYLPCSASNEQARAYQRYLESCDYYTHLHNGHEYPSAVRQLAREQRVTLP